MRLKLKEISEAACAYARLFICKSSIHPDTPSSQKPAVKKSIRELRANKNKPTVFSVSRGINQKVLMLMESIELSKKYSLGNCFEHAALGFEYLINQRYSFNVEIFHINSPDHTIVVMNRDQNTPSSLHEKWNQGVYICDPFFNLYASQEEYFGNEQFSIEKVEELDSQKILQDITPYRKIINNNFNKKYQIITIQIKLLIESLQGSAEGSFFKKIIDNLNELIEEKSVLPCEIMGQQGLMLLANQLKENENFLKDYVKRVKDLLADDNLVSSKSFCSIFSTFFVQAYNKKINKLNEKISKFNHQLFHELKFYELEMDQAYTSKTTFEIQGAP